MSVVSERFGLHIGRSNIHQYWAAFIAVGILMVSTALGFWPTFGDEDILLDWVAMSTWGELLTKSHIAYPHYPPYYLIVKAWGSVAPVETVRFFSVACSLGTTLLTYRIAFVRYGRRAAAVATLLLVLSPVFAIQSHWIRPYPMLGLVITGAWWALLTDDLGRYQWPVWVGFALLTIWTHLFGVVFAAGMVGYQLLQRDVSIPAFAAVAVNALASGILIVGRLLPDRAVQAGGANLSHINTPPSLLDLLLTPGALVIGGILTNAQHFIVAAVSALIIAVVVRRSEYGIFCWGVVPLLAVALGSYITPAYQMKYFSVVIPAFAILLGGTLGQRRGIHMTGALATIITTQVTVRIMELAAENMGAIWIAQYLYKPW